MKTLDLRPGKVRVMSRIWGKQPPVRGLCAGEPDPLPPWARWAGKVADRMLAWRVAGRHLPADGPTIVSIGNLALGGTGKTPVVATLGADLAAAGAQGAILTRGFGSPLAGPLTVEPGNVLAGDEARLMAAALASSGWPVVQARRRTCGLEFIRDRFPDTAVVIVEDGHQTAGLGRHLDVVILDAWTVTDRAAGTRIAAVTGPVMPFGPWRESSAGADRAEIWLLETASEGPAEGSGGQAVTRFQRRITLHAPQDDSPADPTVGRAALLSGIARPESFETSLKELLDREPVLAVRCGDHVQYTPRLVACIIQAVKDTQADFLVTTAKDWIKLEPFWPVSQKILVTDLTIRWGRDKTLPELVGERLDIFRDR
jgi:tetraacyldisaccharide 4'-kinase